MDPNSIQALANLTRHQDWTVRRAAIAALAQRPISEISRHAVLAAMDDPISFVKRGALLAAGALGLTDAAPLMKSALHHADADIREAALEALGGVWNPTDFDAVWRIHRLDPSVTLRKKAAFIVRANVDQSCWQEVFEGWQGDPLPRHRQWAIELVEEFGTATDVPRLAHLTEDRDGHVRRAAERTGALLLSRT